MKQEGWKLTDDGDKYAEAGSPEVQVFNFIKNAGSATKDVIEKQLGEVAKIGMGVAMKNKWIAMDKATKGFGTSIDSVSDEVQVQLQRFETLPKDTLEALKKRKMIMPTSITSFKVKKTDNFD